MTSRTRSHDRKRHVRTSRRSVREAGRIAEIIAGQHAQTDALLTRTAEALGGYQWGPAVITVTP